jgi:hypothetical protein
LNPSHAPGGPQALRDKRAWLSKQGGLLINTANGHSDGFTVIRKARPSSSARKARSPGHRGVNGLARVFAAGKDVTDSLEDAHGRLEDGYRVWTYDTEARHK